jgi:hypothetical protein
MRRIRKIKPFPKRVRVCIFRRYRHLRNFRNFGNGQRLEHLRLMLSRSTCQCDRETGSRLNGKTYGIRMSSSGSLVRNNATLSMGGGGLKTFYNILYYIYYCVMYLLVFFFLVGGGIINTPSDRIVRVYIVRSVFTRANHGGAI